jgi:Tfp pilus assembly protein PilX
MNETRERAGKQGIALVLVLGFLAILTLMSVGFAISMRTEHLVSRAHLDGVCARQLAYTAMARGLDDVNTTVTN